MQLKFKMCRS